jgi:tetratricopeptide (TPR) repeat protein
MHRHSSLCGGEVLQAPGTLDLARLLEKLALLQTPADVEGGDSHAPADLMLEALEVRSQISVEAQAAGCQIVGDFYRQQDDLDAAKECYTRVLRAKDELPSPSLAVATAYTSLAQLAKDQEDLPKACALHRKALEIMHVCYDDKAVELIPVYRELGEMLFLRGKVEEAKDLFLAAVNTGSVRMHTDRTKIHQREHKREELKPCFRCLEKSGRTW